MSAAEDKVLKAGHPPAVKAGGMRVVTKHRHKDHDSDAYDEKYSDTVNAMAPPVKLDVKNEVVMPGGTAKVGKAQLESPTEAVKSFHNKPQPSHSYTNTPPKQNIRINQPRKN